MEGSRPTRTKVLLKYLALFGLGWFLQVLLIFPLAIWGMHLSEDRAGIDTLSIGGIALVVLVYYLFFLVPSVLVIWAGHGLSTRIGRKYRNVDCVQPVILVAILYGFSGPGGILGGLVFALFGYINVIIWRIWRHVRLT